MNGGDPGLIAFGAPSPPPPPRRRRPLVAPLAGVAALALVGGAGVGFAITHSGAAKAADTAAVAASTPKASPSTPATKPAPFKGRHRWGGAPFAAGPRFGAGGVLHGQFTAPKSGGGYQTVDVQRGTVSAVSTSSVTVKSADGFSATYAVTSSTVVDAKSAGIGSVKKGDTIFVSATVSGKTATAANIVDMTAVKAGRASFGFPDRPHAVPAVPKSPAA